MKRKSLQQIATFLNSSSQNSAPVAGFAIDSRKVKRGDLFFALPGAKVDGHQFLSEVAAKGALGAIVSKYYRGRDFGLELLKVADVKEALHQLAQVSFSQRKEKVIGITGSMGKTTTKEFLATLLSARYRVGKTMGSFNTQLTFPLTLLNLEEEYDFLVLEMAMSQRGHIRKLVSLAPPDFALVTRIAPAGMENFEGGLTAIAEAKGEIFSHPKTEMAFFSVQAAQFKEISFAPPGRKCIYGWKEDFLDSRIGDFVMSESSQGIFIQEKDQSTSPYLSFSFEASHLKENFLAAASVARTLGISWQEIQEKALLLTPFEKRFEKIEREGVTFIQDCYNANPDSVCAALRNLPSPKAGGKTIGILGKMPDLGTYSSHYHQVVGEYAKNHLDHLLCIGEEAKIIASTFSKENKAKYYKDLPTIKKALFDLAKPGDVVLIKGANSLKLWEILEE